jgi:hypothetical protein
VADWYCDPSKPGSGDYSATPVAGGTVPTKSEDGNGKGTGTAGMATLVITFTGIPAAAGTITIAGVTFTAVASGATGNQFNAVTSAAQCATNLAAAINASSTPVVNPTMIVSCPLRNAVNATASAGVVTVYTRISGTEWNSVTETESLTNAVITTQWAGGTNGAWGYFFNPSSIAWPNAVSAGAYGAFPGCYLGSLAAGDTVHIRTKRSGSNITVTFPSGVGLPVYARPIGTLAAPLVFLADNGIKWAGDAGVLIFSFDHSQFVNRSINSDSTAGWKQVWSGVNLTDTTRNWRWEATGAANTAGYGLALGTGAGIDVALEVQSMEFTGAGGGSVNNVNATNPPFYWTPTFGSAQGRDYPPVVFRDCIVKEASKSCPIFFNQGSYFGHMLIENCVFDHTGQTQASTAAIMNGPYGARFEANNCRWINFPSLGNQSGFQAVAAGWQQLITMRNCTYTNIKVSGGPSNGGTIGGAPASNVDLMCSINIQSSLGSRFFMFENQRRFFGWIDSAAPKVSTSLLPDGTTSYSIRTAVTSSSGEVTKGRPVAFPPIGKINSLADGLRTATLRLLVDNNIRTALGSRDPKNDEMWVTITYEDTTGVGRVVSSRCAFGATPTSLAAGTSGDWSATSYDVYGSPHNFTAFKIDVSLPNVKQYAELALQFHQGIQSGSTDDLVFLDPEWTLT